MTSCSHTVSLGFTAGEFEPGIHICQILDNDEDRFDSLLKFLASGIKGGEKTCCFSDIVNRENMEEPFGSMGIRLDAVSRDGAFSINPTTPAYFQDGLFDPEVMLAKLEDFYEGAMREGYSGARVIGEMAPEIERLEGYERLPEYESRVSMLLRKTPITAVCQYDSRQFSGSTIMDVLKVHPFMVVKGVVVNNPFWIPPEDFLGITA